MPIRKTLNSVYEKWFAKSPVDRVLFDHVKSAGPTQIVELGLDSVEESVKLAKLAHDIAKETPIKYTCIDLFDARPPGAAPAKLKDVHREFAPLATTVRLLPGDVAGALSRHANQMGGTDLLIVSEGCDRASLSQGWHFIPRMLSPDAVICVRTEDQAPNLLSLDDATARFAPPARSKKAA